MATAAARFIARVFDCVRAADREGLVPGPRPQSLDGLSGAKTVGALERLAGLFAAEKEACYVEIGVFQGLTLMSVALRNAGLACFGIDNFSLLDPEGKNLGIVKDRIATLGAKNAQLINADYEIALARLEDHVSARRIGVFFVDGPHDYRSHLMGLLLAKPYLHETAAIVVDDANYAFVRQSTRDFLLTNPEFKMVFEAYSPAHPANMDTATRTRHEQGWLNGIHVLVRDPDGCLPEMLPPVSDSRTLYVNEWLVHRHQLAELAPDALALAQAVARGDTTEEATKRASLLKAYAAQRPQFDTRFKDRNVYSDGLTEGRYNRQPS